MAKFLNSHVTITTLLLWVKFDVQVECVGRSLWTTNCPW